MATSNNYDASFGGHPFTLRFNWSLASQDIPGNFSTINWNLQVIKTGSFTPYNNTSSPTWATNITSGNWGPYNFNGGIGQTITIASGSYNIGHAADGTGSISASFNANAASTITTASGSGSDTLPTIARATQPTVSPVSGNFGTAYTIGVIPASSTFYHDIGYSLDGGTTYTSIVANLIGTTTTQAWTPAATLLPNASDVAAIIKVDTKASSGGTLIGTKTVTLPLHVDDTIVPTISSVAWVDAQVSAPDIPTLMGGTGRYVQGWSILKPTVTAAGASGSTVTGSTATQNGQVTPSGTAFGLPIALSGATPFSAIATDSRSRSSVPYTNTVPVTAYGFPNLPVPTIQRTSDAAGLVPSPTGTYLRITPTASVSDLTFAAAQKNTIEYQIRVKPTGGTFTTVTAWTSTGTSGVTWTTPKVIAGYASTTQWEVEVGLRDKFGNLGYNTASTVKTQLVIVPTEAVMMDWDGPDGFGFGQYHSGLGTIEVPIGANKGFYQGGLPVVDFGDFPTTTIPGVTTLATSAEVVAGTEATKIVTAATLEAKVAGNVPVLTGIVASIGTFGQFVVTLDSGQRVTGTVSAYTWTSDPSLGIGTRVQVVRNDTSTGPVYAIIAVKSKFMQQVALTLSTAGTGWILYSDIISNDNAGYYGDPWNGQGGASAASANAGKAYATITSTGIVSVGGLLYYASAPASGTIITTLPVGMRPTRAQRFLVHCGAGAALVTVDSSGNIRWLSGVTTGYLSLNNVRFRASGYQTFVSLVSNLAVNWAEYTTAYFTGDASGTGSHTPGYTLDADGVVIFEGAAAATAAVATSANIARAPALFSYLASAHYATWGPGGGTATTRYGASGGVATATAGNGNYLNVGQAYTTGQFVTLDSMIALDPASSTTPTIGASGINGWTYLGSGWRTPSFARTPDGLVIAGGMWASGTSPGTLTIMGAGWRPRYESILSAMANAAVSRVDINLPNSAGGSAGPYNGAVQQQSGSNVYLSLDGLSWPAYR